MIKYTKNGQPYIILSSGRAKFISVKKHKTKHKKVNTMSKKTKHSSRGGIMKFSTNKLLMGAVAGIAVSKFFGDNKLYEAGAGYMIGGIPGAISGFIAPSIINKTSSSTVYY